MKSILFKIPKTGKQSFLLQEDHVPYFYDKLHQHPEAQLTLIYKGEGTLIAGDYIGNFYPDEIYLIGSNLPHVFKSEAHYYENDRLKVYSTSIFFDGHSFGRDFLTLPETSSMQAFIAGLNNCYKLEGELAMVMKSKMLEIFQLKEFDRVLTLLDMLNILLKSPDLKRISNFVSLREYDVQEGNRMNEVLSFTIRESHRNITIKEVAQIASMTPGAFCRYFKIRTRKTYMNFLNEIRVSAALKLLIQKELPIANISASAGFSNLSNFNRFFKKMTGITPTAYRNKASKKMNGQG